MLIKLNGKKYAYDAIWSNSIDIATNIARKYNNTCVFDIENQCIINI